jgi:hypothetical protein
MPERVSGPYRGYYISAAAHLTHSSGSSGNEPTTPVYVGSVNLAQGDPDNAHHFEALIDLGTEQRFATEEEALAHVEQAARKYIDSLLKNP